MNKKTRFIVVQHLAKRAGPHYDLRFRIPGSKLWASFAVRKGIPLGPGVRVLAMRTHDHTEEEALFLGTIPEGEYGAGELTEWDSGPCEVIKYTTPHIIVDFKGKKVKGIYHLVSLSVLRRTSERSYILFKGKVSKQ
jgi:bifunctional non-homologous end joining protein LigD